jgi:oligopeptide transport system substrate-binding protein
MLPDVNRRFAIALLAAAGLVSISACSGGGTPEGTASNGNILLRGNGAEPDSLDPQRARSVESQRILRDLCEGLTTLAKDACTAPGVA